MEAAVDAIVLMDHRGFVAAFNRSAERLFGYSVGEIVGQNVSSLMPEPYRSQHDAYLERYIATGVPHIIGVGREVEALRKDGTVFPAFLSVGRIAGSEPPRFVEMAAGIAHELNQPLSAIATYARARERFLTSPTPDLEQRTEQSVAHRPERADTGFIGAGARRCAGAPHPARVRAHARTAPFERSRIELSVSDNGPGMPAEIVEKLFAPFVTTKAQGTGLGLAISETIARAHGGSIGHRPLSPSGACFFVRLPIIEGPT